MDKPSLSCLLCSVAFDSIDDYVTHTWSFVHHVRKAKHSADTKQDCDLCKFTCDNLADFASHLETADHVQRVSFAIRAMHGGAPSSSTYTYHQQRASFPRPALTPYPPNRRWFREQQPSQPRDAFSRGRRARRGQNFPAAVTNPFSTNASTQRRPHENDSFQSTTSFRDNHFQPHRSFFPQNFSGPPPLTNPQATPPKQRPIGGGHIAQRHHLLSTPLARHRIEPAVAGFTTDTFPGQSLFINAPQPQSSSRPNPANEMRPTKIDSNKRAHAQGTSSRRALSGKITKKRAFRSQDRRFAPAGVGLLSLPSGSTTAEADSTTVNLGVVDAIRVNKSEQRGSIEKVAGKTAVKAKPVLSLSSKKLQETSSEPLSRRLLAQRLMKYDLESVAKETNRPPPHPSPGPSFAATSTPTLSSLESSKKELLETDDVVLLPQNGVQPNCPNYGDQTVDQSDAGLPKISDVTSASAAAAACLEVVASVRAKIRKKAASKKLRPLRNRKKLDAVAAAAAAEKSAEGHEANFGEEISKIKLKPDVVSIKQELNDAFSLNAVEYMMGSEKDDLGAYSEIPDSARDERTADSLVQRDQNDSISATAHVDVKEQLNRDDLTESRPKADQSEAANRFKHLWDICKQEEALKKETDRLSEEISSLKSKLDELKRLKGAKQKELQACQASKSSLLLAGDVNSMSV